LLKRAKREDWQYDYFEEKESTRKTRPIKYKLYQKLLRNEYDAVIVWKLDRWGRSVKELVTEIETLYNRGVKFISIMDPIDLSTDTGWLQFQIISAFAEFERRLISTRTKEAFFKDKNGVTRSRKTGKPIGKRGRDRKRRNRSGYYQRWSKGNQ
jgi:DNA invertase Pin-like site-specific DNA recombinase